MLKIEIQSSEWFNEKDPLTSAPSEKHGQREWKNKNKNERGAFSLYFQRRISNTKTLAENLFSLPICVIMV